MSLTPRAARSWRMRPATAQALAWCGAVAYPILLYVAVLAEPEPTGMRLLLPAVLPVLALPLLRRRPLPTLALMLAGSFAATVLAASKLAASFPFMAPTQAWQIGCLQALVTACVAWVRIRPPFLVGGAKPVDLVQPGEGTLDHPAHRARSGTVGDVTPAIRDLMPSFRTRRRYVPKT